MEGIRVAPRASSKSKRRLANLLLKAQISGALRHPAFELISDNRRRTQNLTAEQQARRRYCTVDAPGK